MKRDDDFAARRAHLANLNDDELRQRFWQLTEKVVDPLLELGRENTTPAIERSVLLRMGFSSLEVAAIVADAEERGLLGYGAGHIVYKLAEDKGITIREAGLTLIEDKNKDKYWDEMSAYFKGGN
ncbi:MAG: ornithine aminomutase subunit alpha [Defluviitaleaceae bacterium]|nr:ornithine aminomutase subunit alpha [Defluviitaleaceae bacterium]